MLGYYIDKKFEGQGIATEAVQCLLKWLFSNDQLQAVIADTPYGVLAHRKFFKKWFFPDG